MAAQHGSHMLSTEGIVSSGCIATKSVAIHGGPWTKARWRSIQGRRSIPEKNTSSIARVPVVGQALVRSTKTSFRFGTQRTGRRATKAWSLSLPVMALVEPSPHERDAIIENHPSLGDETDTLEVTILILSTVEDTCPRCTVSPDQVKSVRVQQRAPGAKLLSQHCLAHQVENGQSESKSTGCQSQGP